MKRTASALTVLVVAALLTGCRAEGLAFRQDKRVKIVVPGDRQTVRLPLVVQWEVTDFKIEPPNGSTVGGRGHFAVFIDREPQEPGEPLSSLADGDEVCQSTPGCPDELWFALHGVYQTTDTNLTIEDLADRRARGRSDVRDRHQVTIVLLDGATKRLGESAFTREFVVDRSRS